MKCNTKYNVKLKLRIQILNTKEINYSDAKLQG